MGQLHKRGPPRLFPAPQMPVQTFGHFFDDLLSALASADIEQVTKKAATGVLVVVGKFLAGTVKIVRKNGADPQK